MPYYTTGPLGTETDNLAELPSSLGLSVGAAVDDAFVSNPSKVIYDYSRFASANRNDKLDTESAQQRIQDAGVKLKIPEAGYSADALDMLIERKQQELSRQSVLARAPAGLIPSSTRFAASLLTGVLDPLNVASAFVPVLGPVRYAGLVADAGGALGRAGVRAAVGAAEGLVGAALLEPINLVGRTQLQDDYGMADSLANLAFGAVLGGGLHAGGGALGDKLGISGFAREQQRKAAKAGNVQRADAATLLGGEPPSEPRPWFASQPVATVSDAPFPKRWEVTPESAKISALDELHNDFLATLTAEAGTRAEPGIVPAARAQIAALDERLAQLESGTAFRQRAKDFQEQGNSRKQAESLARKAIANDKADAQATQQRLNEALDTNSRAAQAEQDLARLDAGEVPERFAPQVESRAAQIVAGAELERAINGNQVPAHFVVGMADPAQRDAAMRAAVVQAMSGRTPDVEVLFRQNADPIGTARSVAERQASPESVAIADFPASRAADERIAAQPKGDDVAQVMLDTQSAKLDALLSSLEQRGAKPERIAALRAELKPFDEAIADSQKLGDAMRAAATCGIL